MPAGRCCSSAIPEPITDVNRNGLSDSELSLDAMAPITDSAIMIAAHHPLYTERRDTARNMARFYALSIEPTLFGEVCLTRRWGRIGASGQVKRHSFPREEEAVGLFLELLREKRGRGYRPRAVKVTS